MVDTNQGAYKISIAIIALVAGMFIAVVMGTETEPLQAPQKTRQVNVFSSCDSIEGYDYAVKVNVDCDSAERLNLHTVLVYIDSSVNTVSSPCYIEITNSDGEYE